MRVLALCGSLRAASVNAALLRASARLAPAGMRIEPCTQTLPAGALPLFNPDLESAPPAVVTAFRARVAAADALLIASPEYAHGITGVMKNALDWLISFEPVAGKMVAVFNASPRARHADEALREILRTMSLTLVEAASVTLPLVGAGLDEEGMMRAPAITRAVGEALAALAAYRQAPGQANTFQI
jgi:NAD(P)H-dependent FMN reductase